jgi:hypothetical protein
MGHVGYALCPHPVLMTRGAAREPGPIFVAHLLPPAIARSFGRLLLSEVAPFPPLTTLNFARLTIAMISAFVMATSYTFGQLDNRPGKAALRFAPSLLGCGNRQRKRREKLGGISISRPRLTTLAIRV